MRDADGVIRHFVAVQRDVTQREKHREGAAGLAAKLVDSLTSPFVVRANRLSAGASVGIAMFPADGQDGDTLVDNADRAMYRAKFNGGKRYHFFEHDEALEGSTAKAAAPGHAP